MCVIVHVNAKKSVPTDILKNCYEHNTNGWGIMWAENGVVHSIKDVSNFDEFLKAWKDVPRHAERGIHFRIMTSGRVCKENCHPFLPVPELGVMHNGIISAPEIDADRSDTYNYCEYEIKPLINGWKDYLFDEAFHKIVTEFTNGSRLLFINGEGSWLRVRDKDWHEEMGIYYSNAHSTRPVYRYASTYGNYGRYYPLTTTRGASELYKDECDKEIERWGEANKESNLVLLQKKDDKEPVSDLYSGNKTDAEGLAYEEAAEEERLRLLREDKMSMAAMMAEQRQAETEAKAEADAEYGEELPHGTYFDIEDMATMEPKDLLDLILDYPKEILYTILGLVNTCLGVGISELDNKDVPTDCLTK